MLSVGCAGGGRSAEEAPRVLAVYDYRLSVRADSPGPGKARLLVLREWTRQLERDARVPSGMPGQQVASVGVGTPNEALFYGLVYVVAGIVWIVMEVTEAAFGWMIPEPSPNEVIRYFETLREPVLRATVASASGGQVFELGIQPLDGYLLDEKMVNALGGPDAEVLIRDRELSATIRLPIAR